MFAKIFDRLKRAFGPLGAALVMLIMFSCLGTLGIIIVAPMVFIPIIGMFALPFLFFPTLLAYLSAMLLIFGLVDLALSFVWKTRGWARQMVAVLPAIGLVAFASMEIPRSLNEAAEIAALEKPLAPIDLPNASVIALIGSGNPNRPCGMFCLSLLLSGQVNAVKVAMVSDIPAPLESVIGWQIEAREDSIQCLAGKPDYSFLVRSYPESRRNALRRGPWNVWSEYIQPCFEISETILDPAEQLTLVNLSEKGLSESSDLVGMNEASYEIRRVVEPRIGAAPAIREVRGQMGRRYTSPLFIYPVDGNAGTGGYFKPVLNTAYYATLVSEGQGHANWWPMITDGEALANDTAELLDDLLSNDR